MIKCAKKIMPKMCADIQWLSWHVRENMQGCHMEVEFHCADNKLDEIQAAVSKFNLKHGFKLKMFHVRYVADGPAPIKPTQAMHNTSAYLLGELERVHQVASAIHKHAEKDRVGLGDFNQLHTLISSASRALRDYKSYADAVVEAMEDLSPDTD
jgi:hypothetical protein